MAKVTGVGKGPEFPPSGEAPKKISRVLADNADKTRDVAKRTVFVRNKPNLKGRVSSGPAGGTTLRGVVEGNMPRWRGW